MARNRRRADGELTLRVMLRRLVIFIVIVGLLLGLVAMHRRAMALGQILGQLEQDLQKEATAVALLKASLDRAVAPRELEQKMAALRIVLVQPSEAQIRRLRDPVSGDPSSRAHILAQADPRRTDARTP